MCTNPQDCLSMVSLLVTGWGVLYGISLGWSIYSLLDHYPRLLRFGSIWSRTDKEDNKKYGPRMRRGWTIIFVFVLLSLGCLMAGAIRFADSSLAELDNWRFPYVFALLGLTTFIIPLFINRAVWGFDIWRFAEEFKEYAKKEENRSYWERRFTLETMQKLWLDPKYAGRLVFWESSTIVLILSLAVSGYLSCSPTYWYWLVAPLMALFLAFVLHFPWPDAPRYQNIDPQQLPIALQRNGKKDE
jgi:membrane protein YdbS with pleckstrin-like domain